MASHHDLRLLVTLFLLTGVECAAGGFYSVLGAFAKLRKWTAGLIRYLCLSLRMDHLDSHWTDFHKTWYIFQQSVDIIKIRHY
jgi:hypothetical protein